MRLGSAGLFATGNEHPYRVTKEAHSRGEVVEAVCQDVFAFTLVVQPREVIFHPNAVAHGWQSVEVLIDARGRVQGDAGPPVPGTYRHDFRNGSRG